MRFTLTVQKNDEPIVSVRLPSSGLTVGTENPSDLMLSADSSFFLSLTPAGPQVAFRFQGEPTPKMDGADCSNGLIGEHNICSVGEYSFCVRREHVPTDQLCSEWKRTRATVQFDSGKDLLEMTTGILRVITGADQDKVHPLESDILSLGSDPECDLVLCDRYVSARHALLLRKGVGYILRDLDSTNGTFIGDTRIGEAKLEPGGIFRLGETEIRLELEVDCVTVTPLEQNSFYGMIGQSAGMRKIFSLIQQVAPTQASVLLEGGTGTGKELAARALHGNSPRASRPFVALNCGAIPKDLVESELFGHVKGAFSNAVAERRGVFELADGGTLLLDEISELPLALQPKLLRVLEQGAFRKVGGEREIEVDVRVVAAANRNLFEMVDQGKFRSDLFYRLSMVPIHLPPLRERERDIPELARHFLAQEARELNLAVAPTLSESATRRLMEHPWPGNVRELRNVIRRALIVGDPGSVLEAGALVFQSREPSPTAGTTLAQLEKEAILRAIRATSTRKQAAKRLGIALSTLYDKLKKYEIDTEAQENP